MMKTFGFCKWVSCCEFVAEGASYCGQHGGTSLPEAAAVACVDSDTTRTKIQELQRQLEVETRRADENVRLLQRERSQLLTENALLRADLEVVRTPVEGVWLWQGDGHDSVDSLSCPVVMRADRLIEIAERLSLVDGHVKSALDLLRNLKTDLSGPVKIVELGAGTTELDAAIDAHLAREEGGG